MGPFIFTARAWGRVGRDKNWSKWFMHAQSLLPQKVSATQRYDLCAQPNGVFWTHAELSYGCALHPPPPKSGSWRVLRSWSEVVYGESCRWPAGNYTAPSSESHIQHVEPALP